MAGTAGLIREAMEVIPRLMLLLLFVLETVWAIFEEAHGEGRTLRSSDKDGRSWALQVLTQEKSTFWRNMGIQKKKDND
jgi:hypothetical protein